MKGNTKEIIKAVCLLIISLFWITLGFNILKISNLLIKYLQLLITKG